MGQWLLKRNTFNSWLSQHGPEGLWIIGKWGTGKSVLASAVIDSLLEHSHLEEETACAYLYCSSEYPFLSSSAVTGINSDKGISYKAILGSLLYQLYGALPQDWDIDSVVHFWRQGTALLETHLEQAVMHAITVLKRAFLVIDGLDELQRTDEADFRAFCRFIGSINQSISTGRVLVFSRPDYLDISSALEGMAVIKIDDRDNIADISAFVSQQVSSLGRMGRYEQQMKDDLIRRANGVFRWVSAVIHYARHLKSPRARGEAVNNMPPGLKDVYARILERILQQSHTNSSYAVKALIWATHAFRPLDSEELVDALSIEPGMTQIDEDDRIDVDKLCEDCYGLLELSDGGWQRSA
ncbi:hypothetical protein GE09DRAFT_1048718 [Coniochaeta sp. 2T2.1]|nr:hypothetical protein GE09DRAFT_1048718 [Coniochaeta sp. 2T2.1]